MSEKKEIENQFTILYDIYEEFLNEDGEPIVKLIKKNCRRKWYTSDIYNLTDIRQVVNRKGIPYKNKCEVYHRFENRWFTVEGRYEDIKKKIEPSERHKIKGFKR